MTALPLRLAAMSVAGLFAVTETALAHGAERGFVLLLPTGHVILAGTIAVALSFAVTFFLPDRLFRRIEAFRIPVMTVRRIAPVMPGLFTAAILAVLVWAGFSGSHDPLENPLPLAVWTVWWVAIVLLHPVVGNLWGLINPFSAVDAIARRSFAPPFRLPHALDYVPAVVVFAGFAWYQLVAPVPDNPEKLARVVLAYLAATTLATVLFGAHAWLERADAFAIFQRLLAAAAPLRYGPHPAAPDRVAVSLVWPGLGLSRLEPLPLFGIFFVLLTLAAVSFDGVSHSFLWLGIWGVNPLDFPGRTAMIVPNTVGLFVSFVALTLLFWIAVALGWRLAGRPVAIAPLSGRLVLSLIPISITFHFAHFLTDLLVNGQYAIAALSDPFGQGLDLLGFDSHDVTTSFLNTASGAHTIFAIQTAAIVAGHVAGIVIAHLVVLEWGLKRREAAFIEAPLAVLMIAYTAFGLWALSSPSIG